MKPSRSAAAAKAGRGLRRQGRSIISARPGAARKPLAPAVAAASANRSSAVASAWPKASPMPQASDPSRSRCAPMRFARLPRIGRGLPLTGTSRNQQVGDGSTERRRLLRSRERRARARRGRVAPSRRATASTASTPSAGATAPRSVARRVVAADADTQHHVCRYAARRAQPNVGGESSQDRARRRRRSRPKPLAPSLAAKRALRQRAAQIGGERAGVENFLGVESGERIAENRNAVLPPRCRARRRRLRSAAPTPRSGRAPGCCRAR